MASRTGPTRHSWPWGARRKSCLRRWIATRDPEARLDHSTRTRTLGYLPLVPADGALGRGHRRGLGARVVARRCRARPGLPELRREAPHGGRRWGTGPAAWPSLTR